MEFEEDFFFKGSFSLVSARDVFDFKLFFRI